MCFFSPMIPSHTSYIHVKRQTANQKQHLSACVCLYIPAAMLLLLWKTRKSLTPSWVGWGSNIHVENMKIHNCLKCSSPTEYIWAKPISFSPIFQLPSSLVRDSTQGLQRPMPTSPNANHVPVFAVLEHCILPGPLVFDQL